MISTKMLLRGWAFLACAALLLAADAAPRSQAPSTGAASSRDQYVGDTACSSCHSEQTLEYSRTVHALASQPAGRASILGSFAEGRNTLLISSPKEGLHDPLLYFKMTAEGGSFYQTAVAELGARHLSHTERIDIVVGSGVRGQTYLYWLEDQLFELPVSYWTEGHRWINSPGYEDGTADFKRHVDPRCLECHASYIEALSNDPQTNTYRKASFVPGIGCESCHGPGAAHVAEEKGGAKHSAASRSTIILNPARFDRERQIDECALCHNGTQREELAPAFSYIPGKPLDEYLAPNSLDLTPQPDVHGNQVGLLKRSRCYLSSTSMSCSTCHDVHAPERAPASYSSRCLQCHQWRSCGMSKTMGHRIVQNCIDCHMPLQKTQAIVSVTAGEITQASIRTHWIKVYPETGSKVHDLGASASAPLK